MSTYHWGCFCVCQSESLQRTHGVWRSKEDIYSSHSHPLVLLYPVQGRTRRWVGETKEMRSDVFRFERFQHAWELRSSIVSLQHIRSNCHWLSPPRSDISSNPRIPRSMTRIPCQAGCLPVGHSTNDRRQRKMDRCFPQAHAHLRLFIVGSEGMCLIRVIHDCSDRPRSFA